ncbi:hypothetical protein ACJIZ3_010210 [Penstemon smallii]|uniref:Uncharacterized protein n=1 Tax=Penstemon smallii TaxID=265156 RepID=A0ABD3TEQ8_9LAMI
MKTDKAVTETKEDLSWYEWLKGLSILIYETIFQKLHSRHLPYPLPLPPLNGINCIVTGSTSGIGLEIARQMAQSGAHLIMAVRNPDAAQEIIKIWSKSNPIDAQIMELDLLSLESVVKFSETYNSKSKPLHLLINNAGIFNIGESQKLSKNGFESHLQVNHLGPALLSILLLPSLQKGSKSRIINVNSLMHCVGFVDTNDMNFIIGARNFTNLKAYSSSKLAQIMFFSELQKRLGLESGVISVICVDPGSVRTNVARKLPKVVQIAYHWIPFLFDALEGSRSAVFAATDDGVLKYCEELRNKGEAESCAYIACNCRPIRPSKEAYNVAVSGLVWEKTLDMIGLRSNAVDKIMEGKQVQCTYEAD